MHMTNKRKRLFIAGILGIPSFLFLAFLGWNMVEDPRFSFTLYDIVVSTWVWAQFGLGYRAYETCDEFDAPPWCAYLFSYQIRILVAVIFISTVAALIVNGLKLPSYLALGISGPLGFVFGREPVLGELLKILDIKKLG